jgi:hypothetical protein
MTAGIGSIQEEEIADQVRKIEESLIEEEAAADQEIPENSVNGETLHIPIFKDERISNSEDSAAIGATTQGEIITIEIITMKENRP